MKKLIAKIILIGIVCGLVMTGLTMLLGCVAFYVVQMTQLTLCIHFMEWTALVALSVGIFTAASWYLYILFVVNKSFFQMLTNMKLKEKK
jgi:hypothetical protein